MSSIGTISDNLARQPILNLYEAGGCGTVEVAGTHSVNMLRMEARGLVKRVSVVRTGQRGRPAIEWRLTDKSRKRAKRALALV